MTLVKRAFKTKVALLTPEKRRILYVYLLAMLIAARLQHAWRELTSWPKVLLIGYLTAAIGFWLGSDLPDRITWGALGALVWIETCLVVELVSSWHDLAHSGAKQVQKE